jgi:hypothetical protein
MKMDSIQNVDVRREFVRKIGVERMVHKLGAKTLDTSGEYVLLQVDLKTGTRPRIYLKMHNPSIDAWHVEPVHPTCRTVQQAINYRRFGTVQPESDWKPEMLS